MNISTTWIHQGPIRVALFLVCFFPALAKAFCKWERPPPSTSFTLELADPVLLIDERVPIGHVMLKRALRSSNTGSFIGAITCTIVPNAQRYEFFYGAKLVAGYSNVFESGIEGIGLRIYSYGATGGTDNSGYLPSFDNTGYGTYKPRNSFELELVRVGQRVGSGTINLDFGFTLFSYAYSGGAWRRLHRLTWQGAGSATVINEAMYASCEPAKLVDTVEMGEVPGKDLRAGRAPVKPFSFDVRCKGLKRPNHAVRAYFEGKSSRAGVLDIQAGPEQASGVALALTDAQNNPLQFGSARIYPLGLTGEDAEGHLYRFDGNAQYVRTDGPLTTGQADAALTYVLDYN